VLPASAFEALAQDYDRQFTDTFMGRLFRQAVWSRLEAAFRPGDRVLELNCGTGEDAIFLARRGVQVVATDNSLTMLQVAQDKVRRAGLVAAIMVRNLDIGNLAGGLDFSARLALPESWERKPQLDGAFSNFGGLNCLADLPGVARGLASCLRSGATLVLCLMGRWVPWEWVWFLWRRQPAKAFRRFHAGGAWWRGLRIYYPGIGTVRQAFAPFFHLRRLSALGVLLPPPYVEPWAIRHRRLIVFLNRWERRLEALPPLPWLADHYLLEWERW
jgi:SAM-dependent methyltransferase